MSSDDHGAGAPETGAPLEFELGEGFVRFPASGHTYRLERAPGRKHRVQLELDGGQIVHIDKLDLSSETSRQRFLNAVRRLYDGGDACRRELVVVAQQVDALLGEPARHSVSFKDRKDQYSVTEEGVFYERPRSSNDPELITIQAANFGGRILEDIEINDGTEDRREFRVEAWHGEIRRTFTLPAKQFEAMEWHTDRIGASAVVMPGPNAHAIVAAAIRLNSDPEKKSIYGHTGWRELDDGEMGYLTATGAITADGLRADVGVHLPHPLDLYRLPDPPTGDDLTAATAAWLAALDVAKRSVTITLWCATLRAILGRIDFSIFLKGATGLGKSQLAALAQQAFGPAFTSDNLPANFTSTANALEVQANLAKDAVMVIDDFQRNVAAKVDSIAERIGRAAGNTSGRARLTRDSQLRSQRAPRGLLLITGEDAPLGQSLNSRFLIVEIDRQAMNWANLTAAQNDAKSGLYAAALSAYIRWIAANYDAVQATYWDRFTFCRAEFQNASTAHHRTTQTAAQMFAAFSLFADYARETGAASEAVIDALSDEAEQILRTLIVEQAGHQEAVDPVRQFLITLEAELLAGRVHFTSPGGRVPDKPGNWGWREIAIGQSDPEWRPQGNKIGWVCSAGGVYLNFTAAYLHVRERLQRAGEQFPLLEKTLLQRLHEAGHLLSRDEKRRTNFVRKTLEGQLRNVIHLAFPDGEDAQTSFFDAEEESA